MPDFSIAGLRKSLLHQVPLLIWLIALWMLLWGSVSWLNLVTGLLIALAVMRIFYLPPVQFSGRFNVWWAFVFAATFMYDVVRGSFQVSYLAVRPGRKPNSAVIEVPLHSRSDLIMLLVSINVSLIPGSLVVEADRYRSILYVHAIAVDDDEDLEDARRSVLRSELRIVRVIGSKDDLVACEHAALAAREQEDA